MKKAENSIVVHAWHTYFSMQFYDKDKQLPEGMDFDHRYHRFFQYTVFVVLTAIIDKKK